MKSKLVFHGNGKVFIDITNENDEVIDSTPSKCKTCMHDAPYKWCCKMVCGESEFCRDCTAESRMVTNKCPYENSALKEE